MPHAAAVFVDSSVWIDYFNARDTPAIHQLDGLLGRRPVIIGDIVLVEVLQGFRNDADFDLVRRHMLSFSVLPVLGERLAVASALNYRRLRKLGITVRGTVDVTIATFCIERGFCLLHSDRDFLPFRTYLGLQVYEG